MRRLAIIFMMLGQPSLAGLSDAESQLHTFANCAGRFSALLEHQWSHDTSLVPVIEQQRSAMLDLVTAVMPPEAGREVLNMRVSAKAAYAQLLRRATSNSDPSDAQWAAQRADALASDCTNMLL